MPPTSLHVDIAVLGAGGAGMRAALEAARRGKNVLCISKVPPTRSHTVAAQGGINASLGNRLPDRWEWHAYDTVRGGDWLGDEDAINFMCEQAPQAIVELEHLGMPFTRDASGKIYQRAYGGQTADFGKGGAAYRACAVADRTGHSLLHTLYAACREVGVKFASEWLALDLLMDSGGACGGLLCWHIETGEIIELRAREVILASGGFGQAWASTTASSICTGDGAGMALRAGLPVKDMEFVQFHPTSLYGVGVLITEGARGEGAILINGHGERFMQRYAPQSMELASRDVISRAIALELREGRGCGPNKDHLYLCLDHLGAQVVEKQLPAVLDIARTFARIDARREPIPVLPAVHYTMGGVPTNLNCEVLDARGSIVPGLRAAGEAACASVHGANRLGCNSLLELIIFGKQAGALAAQSTLTPGKLQTEEPLARLERFRHARGKTPPHTIRKELQQVMHNHAGIFRNAELLQQGRAKLHSLLQRFNDDLQVRDTSLIWNNELAEAYATQNLLLQSLACVESALRRTESRGAHWREDFPVRDDTHWRAHSLALVDETGTAHLATLPLRGAETSPFAPEQRVY